MLIMSIINQRRAIRAKRSEMQPGAPGFMVGTGFVADEIPFYTYWNEFDKSASITLSNDALTATANSNTDGAVRAVDGKLIGKWYFEIFNTEASLTSSDGVGLASGGQPVGGIFFSVNQAVALLGNGSIFLDGSFQFALGSMTGHLVCIAYDADNHLAWFRIEDGLWNDDVDADPALGIGGIDVSTIDANGLWPACGTGETGVAFTAQFGKDGFTYEKPVGFLGWTVELS